MLLACMLLLLQATNAVQQQKMLVLMADPSKQEAEYSTFFGGLSGSGRVEFRRVSDASLNQRTLNCTLNVPLPSCVRGRRT